nr:9201_t:CDS:2 [Entrophospora candida]CAG8628377.1 680_t:CDS:2 [Entrophospora candida]
MEEEKQAKRQSTKSTNGIEEIISNNEIKKDIQESKSNGDDFHTPPPNPHNEAVMTTSQKPILGEHSIQYLVDAILEEIHGWLVNILLDTFESAIMVSLNPENTFQKKIYRGENSYFIQSVYQEYTFDWIEVQTKCIKDAMLFPGFDLTLNKVDRFGFKVASNKETIFIEVSGGPENVVTKHVREDTERLIKEAMFDLVSLFRNILDKNAENARNICTYMVQCIGNVSVSFEQYQSYSGYFMLGDRITLSELRLDKKHFYKISQIKSAMLPFSFERS